MKFFGFKLIHNTLLYIVFLNYCLFSPSGKLVQIEYALAAVAAGGPSVGIKGNDDIYANLSKLGLQGSQN